MRRTIGFLTILALIAAAGADGARGGSIWAKAEGRARSRRVPVYHDDKARGVGDILTIVIKEESEIDSETTRSNDKTSKRSATSKGSIKLEDIAHYWGDDAGTFKLPEVTAESEGDSEFEGSAGFESERTVEDQISVVVHDVLPNGNLVVLGSRRRHVEGDTQIVQVSGIVRPSDVGFGNTVSSEKVADFRMSIRVDGPERRWTRPGWLGRVLNWLSPW
jgi:flagellar L-ring protein precursor FlgH